MHNRVNHQQNWIDKDGIVSLAPGRPALVSVVLPVYNQAQYLGHAIDGVLDQSYPDLELIIVNDGSTDGIEHVLDRYRHIPNVSIINQANQKLPRALNNGFVHAKGEFYSWTSADNIMLPNQVERLVRYLQDHPDAAMVYSDYQAIDDAGDPLNDPTFRPHNLDGSDRSIIRLPHGVTESNFHDSGDNFIGASFMYRRGAAWFIGDYSADTFGGEDYDYWLRMSNFFAIGHLPEVLYKYRVHGNTLNARAAELKIFKRVRKVLQRDAALRACLQDYRKSPPPQNLDEAVSRLRAREILVYDYSRGYGRLEARRSLWRKPFRVCSIDVPADAVDEKELGLADMIVTKDPGCFAKFSPRFQTNIFCFDIERQPELLARLAVYREFMLRNVGSRHR